MVSKIAKARQHLIHKHHIDDPTDQQISDSMGLDVKKVALYSQVARSHASLEDPGDSDALGGHQGEEDCLADVIKDYNPTADDLLMKVRNPCTPLCDLFAIIFLLIQVLGMPTSRLGSNMCNAIFFVKQLNPAVKPTSPKACCIKAHYTRAFYLHCISRSI